MVAHRTIRFLSKCLDIVANSVGTNPAAWDSGSQHVARRVGRSGLIRWYSSDERDETKMDQTKSIHRPAERDGDGSVESSGGKGGEERERKLAEAAKSMMKDLMPGHIESVLGVKYVDITVRDGRTPLWRRMEDWLVAKWVRPGGICWVGLGYRETMLGGIGIS